jgi:hypothetical protein
MNFDKIINHVVTGRTLKTILPETTNILQDKLYYITTKYIANYQEKLQLGDIMYYISTENLDNVIGNYDFNLSWVSSVKYALYYLQNQPILSKLILLRDEDEIDFFYSSKQEIIKKLLPKIVINDSDSLSEQSPLIYLCYLLNQSNINYEVITDLNKSVKSDIVILVGNPVRQIADYKLRSLIIKKPYFDLFLYITCFIDRSSKYCIFNKIKDELDKNIDWTTEFQFRSYDWVLNPISEDTIYIYEKQAVKQANNSVKQANNSVKQANNSVKLQNTIITKYNLLENIRFLEDLTSKKQISDSIYKKANANIQEITKPTINLSKVINIGINNKNPMVYVIIEGMGTQRDEKNIAFLDNYNNESILSIVYYFNYESKSFAKIPIPNVLNILKNARKLNRNANLNYDKLHDRVQRLINLIFDLLNDNINLVLIGISHGSLLIHQAILFLKQSFIDFVKYNIFIYTIGSPRYLPKDLLGSSESPRVINFYHEKDEFNKILKSAFDFGVKSLRVPDLSNIVNNYKYDEENAICIMKDSKRNDILLNKFGESKFIIYHVSFEVAELVLTNKLIDILYANLTKSEISNFKADNMYILIKQLDTQEVYKYKNQKLLGIIPIESHYFLLLSDNETLLRVPNLRNVSLSDKFRISTNNVYLDGCIYKKIKLDYINSVLKSHINLKILTYETQTYYLFFSSNKIIDEQKLPPILLQNLSKKSVQPQNFIDQKILPKKPTLPPIQNLPQNFIDKQKLIKRPALPPIRLRPELPTSEPKVSNSDMTRPPLPPIKAFKILNI